MQSEIRVRRQASPAFADGDEADKTEGPSPIWLSPRSPVQDIDKIDEAWTRPFIDEITDGSYPFAGYKLYKRENSDRMTTASDDCKSLVQLTTQGYETELSGVNYRFFLATLDRCRYLVQLRRAEPATISFVHDINISEKTLHILPAFLDPGISCDRLCRHFEADQKGVPLSILSKFDKISLRGKDALHLVTDWESVIIKFWAKADFNLDKIEDIFVNVSFSMTQGTMWGTRNFVITRYKPDGVLHVINPERYLCRDIKYQCDTSYPEIDALIEISE